MFFKKKVTKKFSEKNLKNLKTEKLTFASKICLTKGKAKKTLKYTSIYLLCILGWLKITFCLIFLSHFNFCVPIGFKTSQKKFHAYMISFSTASLILKF